MTARYDAEAAMIREQLAQFPRVKVPELRVLHDVDELRRLAGWLDALVSNGLPDADAVALDYFRLSARLLELSSDTHDFALSLTRVIP